MTKKYIIAKNSKIQKFKIYNMKKCKQIQLNPVLNM